MSNRRYRVVIVIWNLAGRNESDIGCEWKTLKLATREMKELQIKNPGSQYSIQKEVVK